MGEEPFLGAEVTVSFFLEIEIEWDDLKRYEFASDTPVRIILENISIGKSRATK